MVFEGVLGFWFSKAVCAHNLVPVGANTSSSAAPGTQSCTSVSHPSCAFTHNFETSSSLFFFLLNPFSILLHSLSIVLHRVPSSNFNSLKCCRTDFFANEAYYKLPSHSTLKILLVLLHLSDVVW